MRNGFIFLPFFYGVTIAVTLFFIIYKGSPKLKLDKKFSVGEAIGIALGCGAAISVISWWFIVPQNKRIIDRWEKRQIAKLKNTDAIEEVKKDKVNSALEKIGINLEVKEEIDDDVIQMHDTVEKFDPKAEQLFTTVQVFTAAFDSFAHGANDVANSIGPFASIYSLYKSRGEISERSDSKVELKFDGVFKGGPKDGQAFSKGDEIYGVEGLCGENGDNQYFQCRAVFPNINGSASDAKSSEFDLYNADGEFEGRKTCYTSCKPGSYENYSTKKQDVELWILALGGIGIVAGLAMWGYRIIVAIGVKLTKLTPSRGFSIEIGAAITVIIASRIGLPVSTTHCQVGATVGVGLVEFKKGTVNWKQFAYICVGWVLTVLLTGCTSFIIFSILINTPLRTRNTDSNLPSICPGNNLFMFDSVRNVFRGVGCAAA